MNNTHHTVKSRPIKILLHYSYMCYCAYAYETAGSIISRTYTKCHTEDVARDESELRLGAKELVPALNLEGSITDHVVDYDLCRQDLVNKLKGKRKIVSKTRRTDERGTCSRHGPHKPHAPLKGFFGVLLKLDVMGNKSLPGELPDFSFAVGIPVLDVRRPADAQRPPRVNQCCVHVPVARADNKILVCFGRTRFDGCHETRADPCTH